MTALTDGLHASLHALLWLSGAALPYVGGALLLLSALPVVRGTRRRRASRQLHRAAQRSGRLAPELQRAIRERAVLNGSESIRTGKP